MITDDILREAMALALAGGTEEHPYNQRLLGKPECGTPCCVMGLAFALAGDADGWRRGWPAIPEDATPWRRTVQGILSGTGKDCLRAALLVDDQGSLAGVDLSGMVLVGAVLTGVNLRDADIRDANLRGANLFGANLRGANLFGANLRGANLFGAILENADLRDANLGGASLRLANLSGANLFGADLRGADLTGACGLRTIN